MVKHHRIILFAALALSLLTAMPAVAHAKTTYKTSKPVLSGAPTMGNDFSVSGVITPASTTKSRATVKIKLLMEMGGKYNVMDVYAAKLAKMPAGKSGTKYSLTLTIPMKGKHAVQVLQYRGGKLVSKSSITYFDVAEGSNAQQIAIDANSHADVVAPANTAIDVVFSHAVGCGATIHFLTGSFAKTSSSPLTFHSDGLPPGSYAWQCDMGPSCHGGTLVIQ